MNLTDRQTIVVGIIYNQSRDSLLLSKRPIQSHQGGLLEFPGGKAIPGETPFQTLVRELKEEIGIQVTHARYLTSYNFDYEDRRINLSGWIVDNWLGKHHAREGQELEWVQIANLKNINFPSANTRLLKLMSLPCLYLISPDLARYNQEFIVKTTGLIKNGLKLLQFRSPSSPLQHHKDIVAELLPICEKYNCILIYNGPIDAAIELGVHGAHLNSTRLMQLSGYEIPESFWIGASCHNRNEVLQAQHLGLDYCLISPVHTSITHPESIPIGWDNFSKLAKLSKVPVYALGGIKPGELDVARSYGSYGIAMVSGIWDAQDPISAIKIVG